MSSVYLRDTPETGGGTPYKTQVTTYNVSSSGPTTVVKQSSSSSSSKSSGSSSGSSTGYWTSNPLTQQNVWVGTGTPDYSASAPKIGAYVSGGGSSRPVSYSASELVSQAKADAQGLKVLTAEPSQRFSSIQEVLQVGARYGSVASKLKDIENVQTQGIGSADWLAGQLQAQRFKKEADKARASVGAYEQQAGVLNEQISSYESGVSSFNQKYEGRQLSASEYAQAQREASALEAQKKVIDEQSKRVEATRSMVLQADTKVQSAYKDYQKKVEGSQKVSDERIVLEKLVGGPLSRKTEVVKQDIPTITSKEELKSRVQSGKGGVKIDVKTSDQLLAEGALGTVLKLESQSTEIKDLPSGIKKIGLGIASIPGEAGQIIGSSVAKLFGQKPVFTEDKEFIYKTQEGKLVAGESYSLGKATKLTRITFKEKPFETTLDIGLKGLTLLPGATALIKAGTRLGVKVGSVGKTFIPAEKLIAKDVAPFGKQPFPYVKDVKDAVKTFEKTSYKSALGTGDKYVFSATDYPFKPLIGRTINVTSGRGLVKPVDVPGLYTSTKGVSTYFLRLKQGLKLDYSLPKKLLPDSLFPSAPKIFAIKGVPTRIPASFRTSLAKMQSFFGKTPETIKLGKSGSKLVDTRVSALAKAPAGKPIYSPALELGLKKEAEAVFRVGSELKRTGLETGWQKITGFKFFTNISGRTVPIYELESTRKVASGFGASLKQSVDVSKYAGSSSVIGSGKSVVSSFSLGASAGIISSLKPSSVSVKSVVSSVSVPRTTSSIATISKPSSLKLSSYSLSSTISKPSSISLASSIPSKVSSSSSPRVSSPSVSVGVGEVSKPKPVSSRILPRVSRSRLTPSTISRTYVSRTPTYTPPSSPPPTRPLLSFKPSSIKKPKKPLVEAFDVYSRRRGKKVLIGRRLPFGRATRLGKAFTSQSIARSFVVAPRGFTSMQDVALPKLDQYRVPVASGRVAREGFTFVEKSRFAIDSPLEKQQLKAGRMSVFR